jgi:Domain of unknown function (DUF4372)
VPRFSRMFSQLLKLFPRTEFEGLVKRTLAERHARGFTCWGQFVAMLFCQLGRAHSLREICGGLASCEGKLSHLGITAPARWTLAYANEHRPRDVRAACRHRQRRFRQLGGFSSLCPLPLVDGPSGAGLLAYLALPPAKAYRVAQVRLAGRPPPPRRPRWTGRSCRTP